MSKKTPRGTPAISYRDLMAGKTERPADEPPADATPAPESTAAAEPQDSTNADAQNSTTAEPQRVAEERGGAQGNTSEVSTSEGGAPVLETASTAEKNVEVAAQDSQREASASTSASSAASVVQKPQVAEQGVVQAANELPPAGLPPNKELPPARRRDRSRELTPRELAAVLNEAQAAAAKQKAEIAEAEARAAEEEVAQLVEAVRTAAGGAIDVAHALNAPIIEDAKPRHSMGISSDTMEFAVAAATATLPFKDRVRARAGYVEALRFCIGTEYFATDLVAAEEALERPDVHRVPEMPDQMLGVFSLRGKLIPVFSPTRLLGASLSREFAAAIVLRSGDRRVALAIDDVDDVMTIDLARVRDIPAASDPEGVLLAVAWHGNDLVSLIDAEALLAACQAEQLAETV